MSKVPELFGSMVFNETIMKERLPKETYKAMKKTMQEFFQSQMKAYSMC